MGNIQESYQVHKEASTLSLIVLGNPCSQLMTLSDSDRTWFKRRRPWPAAKFGSANVKLYNERGPRRPPWCLHSHARSELLHVCQTRWTITSCRTHKITTRGIAVWHPFVSFHLSSYPVRLWNDIQYILFQTDWFLDADKYDVASTGMSAPHLSTTPGN